MMLPVVVVVVVVVVFVCLLKGWNMLQTCINTSTISREKCRISAIHLYGQCISLLEKPSLLSRFQFKVLPPFLLIFH